MLTASEELIGSSTWERLNLKYTQQEGGGATVGFYTHDGIEGLCGICLE